MAMFRFACTDYQLFAMSIIDEHTAGPTSTHTIFPVDNYELENERWEDDVILDADNMPAVPSEQLSQ